VWLANQKKTFEAASLLLTIFSIYMNKILVLFGLIIIAFNFGCTRKSPYRTEIILNTVSSKRGVWFKVEQVPFNDEKKKIVDSIFSEKIVDTLIFHVQSNEQRLFKIKASDINNTPIIFVNDVSSIVINVNYFDNNYTFSGSKASIVLKQFEDEQLKLREQAKRIDRLIQNLNRLRPGDQRIQQLLSDFNIKRQTIESRYISFADTVQNPAAFMYVYDNVNFKQDYVKLKRFVDKAAVRFPEYPPIQNLKLKVGEYLKILEEEYIVGERLPDIDLLDRKARPFSLSALRGKVVFVNIWSTWCPQCRAYLEAERKMWQIFPDELETVSIALDDDVDNWKNLMDRENYSHIQLLDKQVWDGVTVHTWKFDSIPVNFLISKEGYIVGKSISPDSLFAAISKEIGKR